MSKEEDLMRRCIDCSALVNQQTLRYWVVYQIKYDFESGGWYSVKDLSKTSELKKYGTPYGAKKYALNLYHKYKKELGEDLEVCIKEELINLDENKKLKNRVTNLEAKLAESNAQLEMAWDDFHRMQNEKIKVQHQLAEKEKSYQELLNSIKIKDLSNINFIQVNEDIVRFSESGVLYEYNKKDNTICKIIDQAHQDKISFAVKQLEKVKEWVDKMFNGWKTNQEVNKLAKDGICLALENVGYKIDNQIEELKKEMK